MFGLLHDRILLPPAGTVLEYCSSAICLYKRMTMLENRNAEENLIYQTLLVYRVEA